MLRFLTAGESHGQKLVTIIEGLPAGVPILSEIIDAQLRRRQGGYGRGDRMKIERDEVQILSGVRGGVSLGSPIALAIDNRDWVNWAGIMDPAPLASEPTPVTRLRPGHADLPGTIKYGHRDVRNVLERASARETTARVAVGAICRQFLEQFGIDVKSHVVALGSVEARPGEPIDWERVEASPLRCADAEAEQAMIQAIDRAKETGDSLGGVFEVIAFGVPIGLGSHVHWDRKLDGRLAQAMMSINAVKAVAVGEGFVVASHPGSQVHDVIEYGAQGWHHKTNRAGGIVGGMSNGEPIVVQAALKPISTLRNPLPSVDLVTKEPVKAHYERSDVAVAPAGAVIGEAMMAIVLAEAFLEKFGGDSLSETLANYQHYLRTYNP